MKNRNLARNRIVSVLLALCMALALLPGTAFADGLPAPQNYEEFKQRVSSYSGIDLSEYTDYTIPWPKDADTLTIGGSITLKDDLEIPSNITLRFNGGGFTARYVNGEPIDSPTVTVHGVVLLESTSRMTPFNCNVKVASGCSIRSADSNKVGMSVPEGWTMTVEEGASIDVYGLTLSGTLTGVGTINSQVSVLDNTGKECHATLSGSFTFTNWVGVGTSNGFPGTLTIPAGSDIRFTDGGKLDIENYGTVNLQGTLRLLGADAERPEKCGHLRFSDSNGGVLNMAGGSVMTVQAPGSIYMGDSSIPPSLYIKGSGTIELYANGVNKPNMFYKYPDELDRNPRLFDDFIATTVTVKRTWVCDEHQWGGWETVREATCGIPGQKTRTCSECGAAEFEDIAPTGEHSWDTGAWSSDAAGHWHACGGCAEKLDAAAHTPGEWIVDAEATASEAGSRHRECTACGYHTETGEIPATGGDTPDTPAVPDIPAPPDNPYVPSAPGGGSGSSKAPGGAADASPDGSRTDVKTGADGTVTTTRTDGEGNVTETVAAPDGTQVTTTTRTDGMKSTVTATASGLASAEVSLPASAVAAARQSGAPVALPIPQVTAARSLDAAPAVTVNTGSGQPVKVEIPAAAPTPGTVAVLVKPDGTQEVIKTSVATAGGITAALPDGATVKVVDNSKAFADVGGADHWAEDAVDFVTARELFSGTGEDTFAPEAPMTRAMLATVLARYDGADTEGGETWYAKGMEWAVAQGISDGSNSGSNITREELAVMLCRYAAASGLDTSVQGALDGFADGDSVSGYAAGAVAWAVGTGLLGGTDGGRLNPRGSATRAEVAAILMRFCENAGK